MHCTQPGLSENKICRCPLQRTIKFILGEPAVQWMVSVQDLTLTAEQGEPGQAKSMICSHNPQSLWRL